MFTRLMGIGISLVLPLVGFNAAVEAQSAGLRSFSQKTHSHKHQHGRTTANSKSQTYTAIHLEGGTIVTFGAPREWLPLVAKLAPIVRETHASFLRLVGTIPAHTASVKLMPEKVFYRKTKAPKWTNAMFYKGEIIIPISAEIAADYISLFRAVRHEYSHSITHALTNGNCPGWLDEGLAQWAEGRPNPALKRVLRNWLEDYPPVPLKSLQGGFTKLNAKMVPAAYAQSLFAVDDLIQTHGFEKVRRYFDNLKSGQSNQRAFQGAFKQTEWEFERRLGRTLRDWSDKTMLREVTYR